MVRPTILRFLAASAVIIPAGATSDVHAQGYPMKAIRLVLPTAPGGPVDAIARPVAQKLSERLGQPVVVDFHPGASGNIGADIVAKSPPDGYTLLVITTAFTLAPSLYAKLPFDPLRDFTPISLVATGNILLVVNPTVPARSVMELVALAKRKPGSLAYGSGGHGTSLHVAGELLKTKTGIDMLHVPYKGATPAMIDVIGGHVDLMFMTLPPTLPHIKAGKLRALGVASLARAKGLPDVPTIGESGLPGFSVDSRYGILAPANLPKDLVAKLNSMLVQVLRMKETGDQFARVGLEPITSTPQEFASYLRNEIIKWAEVVRAARIKPE